MKRASSSCGTLFALCLLLLTWSITGIACRPWIRLALFLPTHTNKRRSRAIKQLLCDCFYTHVWLCLAPIASVKIFHVSQCVWTQGQATMFSGIVVIWRNYFAGSTCKLKLVLLASLCTPTHSTQRLVWVPWCDSRNRASQYPTEVASWQRRVGQIASRIARQKMKAGCKRHGERESESKREDKEWPNTTKQERQSDATNLNSKTWCEQSRQNAALL